MSSAAPRPDDARPETEADLDARTHTLDRRIGELVDVLTARLGADRVLTLRARRSHLPERAYAWARPDEPRTAPSGHPDATQVPPRPSSLFERPEPATFDAADEHGTPRRLRWRGLAYRVRHARGPERIARPWWDDGPARQDGSPHTVREYFRLDTTCGRSLWAFREPRTGQAFVHGEWT